MDGWLMDRKSNSVHETGAGKEEMRTISEHLEMKRKKRRKIKKERGKGKPHKRIYRVFGAL